MRYVEGGDDCRYRGFNVDVGEKLVYSRKV